MASKEPYPFQEDASRWLQSIVNYIKDTQTRRLDFRTLPVDSFSAAGVNIEPVLNALVDSAVVELYIRSKDLEHKLKDYSKILTRTKVEKLTLGPCITPQISISSLCANLKDARITQLDFIASESLRTSEYAEALFRHVALSHIRSLNISMYCCYPHERMSLFSNAPLPTQLTCLEIPDLCCRDKYLPPLSLGEHRELVSELMSGLQRTSLTDLNLRHNDIDDIDVSAIVAFLENSKLVKLNLSANSISDTGIDALIPRLLGSKLSHLNLSCNKIEGDNNLGLCLKDTKIRELDLSANPITDGRMFSSPNFLQGSTVAVLKLGNRLWSRGRITLSCEHLNNLTFSELTCLDISALNLGLEHIEVLTDVLCHSNIAHLNLSDNKLSEECYTILGDCLSTSSLKYINLSKTALSRESVRGIATFLNKAIGSQLVSVDLLSNKLCAALADIATSLENSTLLELNLSHNDCEKSIISLPQQLKLTAITALHLNNNSIGDDGAKALANCLQETEIVVLNLKNNKITSVGASALALTLPNTKLRHLNLKANNIDAKGLKSLAEHAENSWLTFLDISLNPGERKLLVDRVLWENRRKLQLFAELLEETRFFTGDSKLFEFDRDFDEGVDVFIENILKIYKFVAEEPSIVGAIEQDKRILDLKKTNCCKFNAEYNDVFIEDCERVYEIILDQSAPFQIAKDASFFKNQALWLILKFFPTKLVSFIGKSIEPDVEQHVCFLKKVDEQGLTRIVELLLLNRPMYLIDEKQDILHPYVYILLRKYKQTVCNTEIEPEGVAKIIEYFSKHIDLEYAPEVISLLNNSAAPCV